MLKILIFTIKYSLINIQSSLLSFRLILLSSSLMILNNLVTVVIWKIFFLRIGHINGWPLEYVILMLGFLQTSFGLAIFFTNGLRLLPYLVESEKINYLIVSPKPLLLKIAFISSNNSGIGEISSGIILIFLSNLINFTNLFFSCLIPIMGWLFFISVLLLINSLSFFIKNSKGILTELFLYIMMFASQPYSIYTEYVKFLSFTFLPIAFISYFPIKFVTTKDLRFLCIELFGTICLFFLSIWIFKNGINKYVKT